MLTTLLNVLLIIAGFGVLIFVHELGHFLAAKWAGIRTEAFAIGMMHPVLAWRKGIGLRFGSTQGAYLARVRQSLESGRGHGLNPSAELTREQVYQIGDKLGLGETEYSLRWLPIGGFVKMLGQEDANPNAVSDDPRSYTRCPVGKRMVVVSAGVIANLVFAVALFILVFMVGVSFEAPVVGDIDPAQPAARAAILNAADVGVTDSGLKPGDRVLTIDEAPANTFADIQIASAMGRQGVPIRLSVQRAGVDPPLLVEVVPEKDSQTGLLGIGIAPASSNRLVDADAGTIVARVLARAGLDQAGVQPGMRLVRANGEPIETFEAFERVVNRSEGEAIATEWRPDDPDEGAVGLISAIVSVRPRFQVMRYPAQASDEIQNFEIGLLGLTPLVRIEEVERGPNDAVLKPGDVVLRINSIDGPRTAEFRREIARHRGNAVDLVVLRDGSEVSVRASVDGDGRINVLPGPAWEVPLIAEPMTMIRTISADGAAEPPTPFADLGLLARTRIEAVGATPVGDWPEIRRALREQTETARQSSRGADIELTVAHPTRGNPRDVVSVSLSADDVASLHALAWDTDLHPSLFEPLTIVRDAGGSPVRAVAMGFDETRKLILLTYLTIDRLFRGSVGVEQLHGPVGIVHIGTKVMDRGFIWLLFFLAMISVNLAVINFLPIPIVDGGLFLFLVYEKLKGRPPSLAFQNLANLVGVFLIGAVFLITFYNDLARLIG
jgi:regulator of sigma E protease